MSRDVLCHSLCLGSVLQLNTWSSKTKIRMSINLQYGDAGMVVGVESGEEVGGMDLTRVIWGVWNCG